MDIVSLVLTPLLGGVIGYFTNWLAIKMLFRPLEEKRLFGVRLPFTPGLILKERFMLSEKLGETVSKNVLTKEVLNTSINSPEISEKIELVINSALEGFSEKNITLESAAEYFASGSGSFSNYLENTFSERFKIWIEDEDLRKTLADYVSERIIALLKTAGLFDGEALLSEIRRFAETKGRDYLAGEEFRAELTKLASGIILEIRSNGQSLSSYAGENAPEKLRCAAERMLPKAAATVRNINSISPELTNSLRKLTAKIAHDNIGGFVGLFIHYDKLYDKIITSAADYLENEENRVIITDKIVEYFEKWLTISVSELCAMLPLQFTESLPERLAEMAGKYAGQGLIDSILGFIAESVSSGKRLDVYELIIKIEPEFDSRFSGFISEKLQEIITNESPALISSVSSWLAGKISGLDLSAIYRGLSDEKRQKLLEVIYGSARRLLADGGAYVVENLDLGAIIEKKINEFEAKEAEELILSVVNRELKAITWLGGVLGLIIGFVPAIMQAFGF